MPNNLGQLSTTEFLARFWQREPCVIRQAIPSYHSIISADELAGLACEPEAEARLVSGNFVDANWDVLYGPFTAKDFQSLPDIDWTLLVQDVEKHIPVLQHLLAGFGFLPGWRIDDIMASYSVPGGSVGPHADRYDVFLLQADGCKRWQIAQQFDPACQDDSGLNVLERFEPETEWLLEPGDILYLPPGIAHHGIAIEKGFTYSIGFRAPSAADLMQAMGEWLAENRDGGKMYRDPNADPIGQSDKDQTGAALPGELTAASRQNMLDLLREELNDNQAFACFSGEFISRFRTAVQPEIPQQNCTPESLVALINDGHRIQRNPWTRLCWIRTESSAGDDVQLFASGDRIWCSGDLAVYLCSMSGPGLESGPNPGSEQGPEINLPARPFTDSELVALCELVNLGHLLITGEQPE